MKRRLFTAALTIALVLSASACGSSEGAARGGSDGTSQESGSTTTSPGSTTTTTEVREWNGTFVEAGDGTVDIDAVPAPTPSFTVESFNDVAPVTISGIGSAQSVVVNVDANYGGDYTAPDGGAFWTFKWEGEVRKGEAIGDPGLEIAVDLAPGDSHEILVSDEADDGSGGTGHAPYGPISGTSVIQVKDGQRPLLRVTELNDWSVMGMDGQPDDRHSRVFDLTTGKALPECTDKEGTKADCLEIETTYLASL